MQNIGKVYIFHYFEEKKCWKASRGGLERRPDTRRPDKKFTLLGLEWQNSKNPGRGKISIIRRCVKKRVSGPWKTQVGPDFPQNWIFTKVWSKFEFGQYRNYAIIVFLPKLDYDWNWILTEIGFWPKLDFDENWILTEIGFLPKLDFDRNWILTEIELFSIFVRIWTVPKISTNLDKIQFLTKSIDI